MIWNVFILSLVLIAYSKTVDRKIHFKISSQNEKYNNVELGSILDLKVAIQDTGKADAPATDKLVAKFKIKSFPQDLTFLFNRCLLDNSASTSVSVRVELKGELMFINDMRIPVSTSKAEQKFDVKLKPLFKQ